MATLDVAAVAQLEAEVRATMEQLSRNHTVALAQLNPSLHESDMRSTSLKRLTAITGSYRMGLVVIRTDLLHFKWWDDNWGRGLTNDQKMSNAGVFYSALSFGTFVAAFSTLEAAIRQILYTFDPAACNESTAGYYRVRKHLFDHNLNLDHSQYETLFDLLSVLRNCIHNMGVYRDIKNPNRIIEYEGFRYTFLHMVPPNCLQPENLVSFIGKMGEVLFDIMNDSRVIALGTVEDGYEKIGTHNTVEPI